MTAIGLFLMASSFLSAGTPSNASKLDSLFASYDAHHKLMGSIAIARNGTVVYERAIGKADVEHSVPNTPATRFHIGSISKSFTATMIMQLVDEGALQLTTPLSTYFPTIPNATKITIKHLLQHSSGIHNFTNDASYATYQSKPRSRKQYTTYFTTTKPDFEPGSKHDYSNSNYVLLSFILEDVTKRSYAENLLQRITRKVGLRNTSVGSKIDPTQHDAYSYRANGSGWSKVAETDPSVPIGAGAIVSTPSDLCTFFTALFQGKLTSAASLAAMQTFDGEYGLGLFTFPHEGRSIVGHNGGIDGFTSFAGYFKDDSLSIAYTSNGSELGTDAVVTSALKVWYGAPFQIPTFEDVAVDAATLATYVGVYRSAELPIEITVRTKAGHLVAQGTGQSEFTLDAKGNGLFTFDPAGIRMTFEAAADHSPGFTLRQGGQTFAFTRKR